MASQFGSSTPWAQAAKNFKAPVAKKPAPKATTTTQPKPVAKKTTPKPKTVAKPKTFTTPVVEPIEPVVAETAAPEETVTPWSLNSDPLYQQGLASGQAQFNYARNAALADQQNQATSINQQRKSLDTASEENRRRLAGNYAARGMAGGAAGALTMAEARANADQVASRTSLADQLTAVNAQFLQNYGAIGSDWTGTLVGQQYKTQAAQAALEAALARYGTV